MHKSFYMLLVFIGALMALLYFEVLFSPSWLLILICVVGSFWLLTMRNRQ